VRSLFQSPTVAGLIERMAELAASRLPEAELARVLADIENC